AIRRYLNDPANTKEFDPRKFLVASTKAMADICQARFEAFGSAGQASKIKALACDKMAERYKKGELAAIIK
ncbi:MAG TPA: fructose-1,6-bisphosphate aldolase, partial [Methylophilaceae bacterium]|nr:fructose-1,6-bisphosphate aldolase [Methylophilaceae bacterium]